MRGQNALFEIAMKQYSGRLMILEWGGGAERFSEDSQEAMFKTLDDALTLDFCA